MLLSPYFGHYPPRYSQTCPSLRQVCPRVSQVLHSTDHIYLRGRRERERERERERNKRGKRGEERRYTKERRGRQMARIQSCKLKKKKRTQRNCIPVSQQARQTANHPFIIQTTCSCNQLEIKSPVQVGEK